MSACEWCWGEAQRRVGLCGGSVADRYMEILAEQDAKGAMVADCPGVRGVPMGNGLLMLLRHPAHAPDHPIGSLGEDGDD